MAARSLSLQDHFLNSVRRAKLPVTIFLVKGVKLQGVVTWFDAFSLLLRREGAGQLVYKHSISTIMPSEPPPDFVPTTGGGEGAKASLQDQFLNAVRRSKSPALVFLVKGVKLQGVITWFDAFSLLLRRDSTSQLIYKHAISTIMPQRSPTELAKDFQASGAGNRASLQDVFLAAAARDSGPMTLFLVNGVMLQGNVVGYDQFSVLLERDEQLQLVYKHAISTLQPPHALDLGDHGDPAEEPGA